VHQLVWLLPALFLLLGDALDRRDRVRLAAVAAVYIVLSSSVVWLWWAGTDGWPAAVGSNTYVWISLRLLVAPRFSAGTSPVLIPLVGSLSTRNGPPRIDNRPEVVFFHRFAFVLQALVANI
jgi:hypothetical protein